jgi:uncharacterized membrane protein
MDDEHILKRYERRTDPTRVLALSDGVFAIVITLLVLEIQVPDLASGQTLAGALREVRPSFIAFLISFVVVAIAWAGHRDLFALIRRTDPVLVWLNILYLLPLSVLPFGASLIARHGEEPVALEMYGILLVAIAVTRMAIWWYGTGRPHLLFSPVNRRSRWAGFAVVAVSVVAYAVAIAVADTSPVISFAIYGIAPILYFIGLALARTTAPPGSPDENLP